MNQSIENATLDNRNFTVSISVDNSPEEVFDAINDVRGWWSGQIDGRTDGLGEEFTYRYEQLHRTVHKITEWVPGKKVVWRVIDSHIAFAADKQEWNGTEIVFEIERRGDKTVLQFTHKGLVPQIECHGRCSRAWTFFITDSLRERITTGQAVANLNV